MGQADRVNFDSQHRDQAPKPAGGRRRRVRSTQGAPPSQVPAERTAAELPPAPQRHPNARGSRPDGTDSALRDLVGAGPSQLGVSGALRGRDVNRPTEQDLAEAERDVVIVRRNWRPPA